MNPFEKRSFANYRLDPTRAISVRLTQAEIALLVEAAEKNRTMRLGHARESAIETARKYGGNGVSAFLRAAALNEASRIIAAARTTPALQASRPTAPAASYEQPRSSNRSRNTRGRAK